MMLTVPLNQAIFCLDVENLFAKIKAEQSGKLDVLVNNAYAGVDMIFKVLINYLLRNFDEIAFSRNQYLIFANILGRYDFQGYDVFCIFKKKIIHLKYVVIVSKHNRVDADDISPLYIYICILYILVWVNHPF